MKTEYLLGILVAFLLFFAPKKTRRYAKRRYAKYRSTRRRKYGTRRTYNKTRKTYRKKRFTGFKKKSRPTRYRKMKYA